MKKLLVTIASYGSKNTQYLKRVLSEYRSMSFSTDIVVLSNVPRNLEDDVEVRVGLPVKDPMSLPFSHKQVFAERQDSYDLFLYSEDDILITQKNIEAFLAVSELLPAKDLAGFFRFETHPNGATCFPDAHGHFRWDPTSVKTIEDYTFAHFTNEHSGCYLLTQRQLKEAIASGGFLVQPHQAKYTLLETAATDPYTQCGFRKLMCISHFEDFLVAHLPNRYAGSELSRDAADFYCQIAALRITHRDGEKSPSLLQPETKLLHRKWSKDYYEPARHDLASLVPPNARSVLSIGCGWGATEALLVERGVRVVAVPLDPIIAASAEARGVQVMHGDLATVMNALCGEHFDGVLISGSLHLFRDPEAIIRVAVGVLADNGVLIATFPNISRVPFLRRYLLEFLKIGDFERSGMHRISRKRAAKWFTAAGLQVRTIEAVVPSKWKRIAERFGSTGARLFSLEFAVVGTNPVRQKRLEKSLDHDCVSA